MRNQKLLIASQNYTEIESYLIEKNIDYILKIKEGVRHPKRKFL